MLQALFGGLVGLSLLYGLARGDSARVIGAMIEGAGDAVQTALTMAGGFALFCGMLGILRRSGAADWLANKLSPLIVRLLGPTLPKDALRSVTLNLTANALGLGNAATPMGVEAACRMGRQGQTASDALCLFLVINSSSVQLIPSSVIALRAAEGSADPARVTAPTLAATLISTLVGVLACKIAEKWT